MKINFSGQIKIYFLAISPTTAKFNQLTWLKCFNSAHYVCYPR